MIGKGGAEIVMLLIQSELLRFMDFTGCEWSPGSIEELLSQIKVNYGHLTIAQWKLFFAKAKSGQFAQEGQRDNQTMIARVTPLIFTQWLSIHAAKCEEANELYYATQQSKRLDLPDRDDYVPMEAISEAFSRFADEWEANLKETRAIEDQAKKRKRIEGNEKLLRSYCQANGLDYDTIKSELDYKNNAA